MQYKVAKTIGLNTDQKASQVIHSFCDDENVFLAVLTLEADDAFVFGRQLLSDLVDSFCENDTSPGEKLSTTYEEAKKTLEGKQFNLLLAAVSTKVLYLIGVGEVTAILKRDETISPLLQNGSEQLISGFLQEGDKVFLATERLNTFLGDNLSNSLKLPLSDWEDEMGVRLNEEGVDSGSLAGILLEVEQPEEGAAVSESEVEQEEDNIAPLTGSDTGGEAIGTVSAISSRLINLLPKSGRIRLILALVIIVIISSVVTINFFGARSVQKDQEVVHLLEQARSAKTEAEGLKALNVAEAEKKLNEAFSLVDKALKIKSSSKGAQDLKKELEESAANILQKFSQTEVTELTDLDRAKSGFVGSKMSLLSGSALILDSGGGSLISLDLAKNEAKVLVEGDDLGKANEVVLDEDVVYVYSQDKGVLKVDLANKKVTVVIKPDVAWGDIRGLSTFGGNLYLLDAEKDQIWKYLPTTAGFSNSRNYFTSDTKVDLVGAVSLQIDSAVYALKQNSEILKFIKGAKEDFSLTGLDKDLKEPKAIFVSADTENLYVLDSGNSRIVVLGKSGEYKAQYESEKLGVASSFAVDEKGKKIYLLDGSKVFQMDLK